MSKYEPRTLKRGEVIGFYIETTTEPTLFSEPRLGFYIEGRVTLDTAIKGLARTGSSKLHMDMYQLVRVSGLMHGSAVIHCL